MPRLRTVLLLSNLAILALPVAGLWAPRLYESALVRQTESELVAQAAVLASVFREQMHVLSGASAPGTPPQPSPAALHMARRPGLDLAVDPILPPQPGDQPAAPADPAAIAAGQALTPVLRDAQLVTLASLRVTDRHGVIVATTSTDLGRGLTGWTEVARVLAGEPIASGMHQREPAKAAPEGISRTSAPRVFVALPVADPAGEVAGVVVLSRTPSSLADTIWGKRKPLIVLTLLLIAGGVALAAGISRLVTRPLRILVRRAQAVAAGEAMAIDPGRTGTREVAELSDAIARMARTLEQRAGYISGFAASVSHEFKTPMTAIRAAAELLDEHADSVSPEERRRLLGVVSDGVARLELLVRRLVELARADMTTRGEAAIAAVDPIVRRVAERYRQTGMTVAVTGAAGAARLPEDALDALMTTMLENAAAHATGAAVDIVVEADGDHVRITVRDDGPGTPPAHQVRAFEPFFTTARGQGGTGLGLPIVRAIVAGVGGSVTLLPTQAGAAFLISLPAAT